MSRVSQSGRTERLDEAVEHYKAKGYEVVDLRTTKATLYRSKRWNWIAFLAWTILSGGMLFFVYPIYFLLFTKGTILEINVDGAGNAKGHKTQGNMTFKTVR